MIFPDLQKYKLYNKLYKQRKFCKTMNKIVDLQKNFGIIFSFSFHIYYKQ